MCRLIGFVSPTPTTLSELIGGVQCATFQHMSRLHADGWGTMNFDDHGHIESRRTAAPGQDDPRLTNAMEAEATRGRVIHLRLATDGMPVGLENSHPFVADGIGLAHNGSVVPTGLLRDTLSKGSLAGVHGNTDSELYLAAVRQAVKEGLTLSEAVTRTVHWLRETYPVASLNALVLSRHEFVVVHASSLAPAPHEEFAATGIRQADLPRGHIDEYYQMSYLRRADGAVAFSSTGIDPTEWTPVAEESITTVDLCTYEMTTRSLRPAERGAA